MLLSQGDFIQIDFQCTGDAKHIGKMCIRDRYAAVVLDAEGNPLSTGGFVGTEGEYAVGEHDVSTIYVYVCDALEYMDELKGYYWSDTYGEQKKTKTFKELLDERAIYHQEVAFDK